MSDSDDTDILLLIPPDFFISEPTLKASADYNLIEKIVHKGGNFNKVDELGKVCNRYDAEKMDLHKNPLYLTPKSHSYSSSKQFEYKRYEEKSPGGQSAFTIATSERLWDPINSTPNKELKPSAFVTQPLSEIQKKTDGNILEEIDQYLGQHQYVPPHSKDTGKLQSVSKLSTHFGSKDATIDSRLSTSSGISRQTGKPMTSKIYGAEEAGRNDEVLTNLVGTKMSDWSLGLQQNSSVHEEGLINLNKIWHDEGRANHADESKSLEEERLKCRQYKRTIQSLQNQLKQYQDKYSDVIKIDKTKNDALARLHDTNSRQVNK